MKSSGTARVLATLFLGVIFGTYIHFDQMRWQGRGRDAFLAYQGHRFDRIALHHSGASMLVAGVILAMIAVGLYEVVVIGITKVLPPSTDEE